MDRKILTPSQQVTVAGLRVLRAMDPDDMIVDGVTAEDVARLALNNEFKENGLDGVRLIESQVEQQ